MSRNLLSPHDAVRVGESPDIPEELPNPDRDSETEVVLAAAPRRHCLYANLKAFFWRFLALARKPKRLAPLAVDYWLLLQSIWSAKQSGPGLVYPMLSIRKRQSGRLAQLILDHSRNVWEHELRAASPFPKGIDPPTVAVIDLDEVPQGVTENGYSTQADLHGLMFMFMLIETVITFLVHVFLIPDSAGWVIWLDWAYCAMFNLGFCLYAVFRGDGTLTLALRSDSTSSPGCAILLDQDFTVVLNGSQGIVEAIAESSFNLSHPDSVWSLRLLGEEYGRDSSYDILEPFCDSIYLTIFVSCWLLFRPSTTTGGIIPLVIVSFVVGILQDSPPDHFTSLQETWFVLKGIVCRGLFPILVITMYEQAKIESSLFAFDWQRGLHLLSFFLVVLFSAGYNARNYPIRSGKFLDAIGHPPVRKWQFDTLAAAVTFQSLVLCCGAPRPIRSIDILALLDMLVPDQRDVWKAWKERVADRIMHEKDISFTPTIPTFPDGRQQRLKELLDQAQRGYEAYKYSYEWYHG